MKNLWRGAFNYRQTAVVLYRYAHSKRQAWKVMCDELAKKDGIHPSVVYSLFDGSKDNHEISIEMEVKENERP
uniref:Uncharacterized protein n=1 Tax=viral metagenome TaxID=1070528 RepID=A0A6M3LKC4_9ZZZZ